MKIFIKTGTDYITARNCSELCNLNHSLQIWNLTPIILLVSGRNKCERNKCPISVKRKNCPCVSGSKKCPSTNGSNNTLVLVVNKSKQSPCVAVSKRHYNPHHWVSGIRLKKQKSEFVLMGF